jgi:hypothetical protein
MQLASSSVGINIVSAATAIATAARTTVHA